MHFYAFAKYDRCDRFQINFNVYGLICSILYEKAYLEISTSKFEFELNNEILVLKADIAIVTYTCRFYEYLFIFLMHRVKHIKKTTIHFGEVIMTYVFLCTLVIQILSNGQFKSRDCVNFTKAEIWMDQWHIVWQCL